MHSSEVLADQWRKQQAATQGKLITASVTAARAVFSQEAPGKRRDARLQMLADREIFLVPGPIIKPGDNMAKVAADLKKSDVQAVEILFGNYGCEDEIARLAKELGVPILLNAPYDGPPADDGRRLTDGWCGLMPASKLLRDHEIPFLHMPHCELGSDLERARFDQFVRASEGVRMIRNVRIGQIGGNQPTFVAIGCSPEVLGTRFGVQTVDISLTTLFKRIRELEETEKALLDQEVEALGARMDISGIPREAAIRIAAGLIAELEMCIEHNLDGLTVRCWDEMMAEMQMMQCVINSILLDLGVPNACETDRGGLLSMMMMQALSDTPPMFADITVAIFDDGQWKVLVWHCGTFASSICRECKACEGWIIPVPKAPYAYVSGVVDAIGESLTMARLVNSNSADGIGFGLSTFEAPIVEGPFTRGTHLWCAPPDFHRLENRLVRGYTVHHFAGAIGEHAHLVQQVADLIGVPSMILNVDGDEITDRILCRGQKFLVE